MAFALRSVIRIFLFHEAHSLGLFTLGQRSLLLKAQEQAQTFRIAWVNARVCNLRQLCGAHGFQTCQHRLLRRT